MQITHTIPDSVSQDVARALDEDVADGDCLGQAFERVPCGDELMADIAFVACFYDLFHNRREVDFLLIVEFATSGIAGGETEGGMG